MPSLLPEKVFQNRIIDYLVKHNGFVKRSNRDFNPRLAMDSELLIKFIKTTQPKAYADLKRSVKGDVDQVLFSGVRSQITREGGSLIEVLTKGAVVSNIKFDLLYRRPATSYNKDLSRKYSQNIFSVMDEVLPSEVDKERIDLVLFVNGLAIVSVELKYRPQQCMADAVKQYRSTRDPKSPLFAFKQGCLVSFAMDQTEVSMTTKLDGEDTFFRPFNKGRGEGVFAGAGNPDKPDGYAVSYMWEDIWTKDTLTELITSFIHLDRKETKDTETGKSKVTETLIFPRYHQLDAVRKILADVKVNKSSKNYLIQHSAGSGKTNTIVWLAHRLSSLHSADDKIIFDTIIVVTDRVVVDRQLQAAVSSAEHQAGLVKTMDDSCTSADLAAALNGNTKIIVTTIQKFPYILDSVRELKHKTFGVIIDEAHSSTAGADMKALADALSSGTPQEGADFDLEDAVSAQLTNTGKRPNLSVFAFTATPKPTTLEIFGTPDSTGHKSAFHIYSMRQAIEEGYILNVLQNYTEYKVFYQLVKTIADDPSVDPSRVKMQIARFVDLHPDNIAQRIEIIVEHFRSMVLPQLNYQAKAMVVTASREAAVRCYLAMRKYIADNRYNLKALVAFSGKVSLKPQEADGHEIDGGESEECTEVSLNGIREEQLPLEFNSSKYQLLLVADKYQTGFDQPKLCAMYIMKKLSGVKAVQTLSRLNRICPPFDKQVFILDFVNTAKEMEHAFEPYFTTTMLSDGMTKEKLEEMAVKLDGFGITDPLTIDEVCEIFLKLKSSAHDAKLTAKLERIINQLKNGADKSLDEEKRKLLPKQAMAFIKAYRFFVQVTSYDDPQLYKKYIFWDVLQPYLVQGDLQGTPFDLKHKIKAEQIRVEKVQSTAEPQVVSDPFVDLVMSASIHLAKEQREKLSDLIKDINARFGRKFDEQKTVETISKIKDQLSKKTGLQACAQHNTEHDFGLKFADELDDVLTDQVLEEDPEDVFEQGKAFCSMLLDNDEVKRRFMAIFVPEFYRAFRQAVGGAGAVKP